jgi:hypothetical protein
MTGRVRFRQGWTGALVLQVEYTVEHLENAGGSLEFTTVPTWRDATVQDLTSPRLREFVKIMQGPSIDTG